jgi:hypothetical protein
MKPNRKEGTITFKADEKLTDAMAGIPNRSEFIRGAILAALDSTCPLCRGTGILTPTQKLHWERFSETHTVQECQSCHAYHLVCGAVEQPDTGKGAQGDA